MLTSCSNNKVRSIIVSIHHTGIFTEMERHMKVTCLKEMEYVEGLQFGKTANKYRILKKTLLSKYLGIIGR